MKTVPVVTIVNSRGSVHRIPERDQDGETVWDVEVDPGHPEVLPVPKRVEATTITAIEMALYAVPNSIARPKDSRMMPKLFRVLDSPEATLASDILVFNDEDVYDWFHKLLGRSVPLTVEEKAQSQGAVPLPYADRIFTILHSHVICQQLKDPDDRDPEDAAGSAGNEDEDLGGNHDVA